MPIHEQYAASFADEHQRLAICSACEFATGLKSRGRVTPSSQCEQNPERRFSLTAVAVNARAECPIAKWGRVEGTLVEPVEPIRKRMTEAQSEELEILKAVERAAAGEAEGVGDLLAAYFDKIGASAAAALYRRWTGAKCACPQRIAWLNRQAWLTSFARNAGLL